MEYFYTIILGFVQGVTEFVPISSSGHLVLLHEWLPITLSSELAFDVALHGGTLLAIIIYFAKDIVHYLLKSRKMIWFILVSSIPAGITGILFESFIDEQLRSPWVVVAMLFIVACWFLFVEKMSKQTVDLDAITWKQVVVMGFAQICALIPGTSRSGITMSTGMMLGLQRQAAARFSFLMAIPVLGGATLKKTYDLTQVGITSSELGLFAIGAIVSAVTGLIVIRFLLRYFQKHSLRPFAWYRIGLAVVVILAILL